MTTTAADARNIRRAAGLSTAGLAKLFRVGKGGDRTVRRWEAGDRAVPGPVTLLYDLLKDGTLAPDDTPDQFVEALRTWRRLMAPDNTDVSYEDPFDAEADAPADDVFDGHPPPSRTPPEFHETFKRYHEEHHRNLRVLDAFLNLKTDDIHDLFRVEAWCIRFETSIIEVLWELRCARVFMKDPRNVQPKVYQAILAFEKNAITTLRDLHAARTGEPTRLIDIIERARSMPSLPDFQTGLTKPQLH